MPNWLFTALLCVFMCAGYGVGFCDGWREPRRAAPGGKR